jgi:N-acyl-L-homoserine lactone synthetase
MIRFIYADAIAALPELADSMFRDRARQFHQRLGWDVQVDARGCETDRYDRLNPLYAIWQQGDGRHGGSMRFLPTTGETMINDHFTHLTDGVRIASPLIWECTRFCIAPGAGPWVAGALMMAGCAMGLRFGLSHAVGIFDGRMVPVYRRLGWVPEILGRQGSGRDSVSTGLWAFERAALRRMARRSGLAEAQVQGWLEESFALRPVAAPVPVRQRDHAMRAAG